MGKPRFQALVDLHAAREDEARRTLGKLENHRAGVIARIDAVIAARERAARECDPRLRHVYDAWSVRIETDLTALREQVRLAELQIDQARAALIAAHRERAVFVRLRDRTLARLADARERREARELDDLAAARAVAIPAARSGDRP